MAGIVISGYDAARLGTIGFTLTETGGGDATGSVSLTGQYLHNSNTSISVTVEDPLTGEESSYDTGYLGLRPALITALDAIGNASYSVSFNINTGVYTISASGGGVTSFAISSVTTGAARMLGIDAVSGSLSYVAPRAAWHYWVSSTGGFSEWTESAEDIDGEDLRGADGSTRGLVAIGSPRRLDFVVPWEPLANVWSDAASSTAWTWQRFFQRVRTIEPLIISDPRGSAGLFGYLRQDACVLRPRLASADYLAYQSIPIGMYVTGSL